MAIHENNPTRIIRATRDIDGDWYGNQPIMEQIEKQIQEAVKAVDPELVVYAVREFSDKRVAGFRIDNAFGEKVASIDLSIRHNQLQEIWEDNGRVPGDFSFLKQNMSSIGESYNKMVGIENKPDFLELYYRLLNFIQPLTLGPIPKAKWNVSDWEEATIECEKGRNR